MSDMAVERPDTGVEGVEGNGDVRVRPNVHGIAHGTFAQIKVFFCRSLNWKYFFLVLYNGNTMEIENSQIEHKSDFFALN